MAKRDPDPEHQSLAAPEERQASRLAGEQASGRGWRVWMDGEGILWTRDTLPQDEGSSAARLAAMERFLGRDGLRGVLVDDREPAARTAAPRSRRTGASSSATRK